MQQREICVVEEKDSNPMDQQILWRQLKRVDVKCVKIDERVHRSLKAIYSALGVSHRPIIIQETHSFIVSNNLSEIPTLLYPAILLFFYSAERKKLT